MGTKAQQVRTECPEPNADRWSNLTLAHGREGGGNGASRQNDRGHGWWWNYHCLLWLEPCSHTECTCAMDVLSAGLMVGALVHRAHTCLHACVYMCVHYVSVCACRCVYACVYMHIYVCTCVWACMHMHFSLMQVVFQKSSSNFCNT